MNEEFHEQLYASMDSKNTDELLEIWQTNDRTMWSEEAFLVIQEVLSQRLEVIPPQSPAILSKEEESQPKSALSSAQKHFRLGIIFFLAAIGLYCGVMLSMGDGLFRRVNTLSSIFTVLSGFAFLLGAKAWSIAWKSFMQEEPSEKSPSHKHSKKRHPTQKS